jgi:hypothetical protein
MCIFYVDCRGTAQGEWETIEPALRFDHLQSQRAGGHSGTSSHCSLKAGLTHEPASRWPSSRPGRSTAGSSRRSTILSRRPTVQQLTRAARAHTVGATDPPHAMSDPPPVVDDPGRSRSRS